MLTAAASAGGAAAAATATGAGSSSSSSGGDGPCASCCCCLCCCGSTLELFRQQRLPAWSPLLTPRYIARWLLVLALLMGSLAVLTIMLDRNTHLVRVRYDHVAACTATHNQGAFAYTVRNNDDNNDGDDKGNHGETVYRTGCVTDVRFTLTRAMRAPVYVYYELTRFHQSHRRFATSLSAQQLRGAAVPPRHELARTSPLARPSELRHELADARLRIGERVYRYGACVYAPAGIIAWSMFNDSFTLFRVDASTAPPPPPTTTVATTGTADAAAAPLLHETLTLLCNGSAFSRVTNEPLANGPHDASAAAAAGAVPGRTCHKRGIAWHTDVATQYKPLRPPPPHHHPDHHADAHDEVCVWSAPKESAYGWPAARAPPSNDSYYNAGWYAGEAGHAVPVTTDEDLMVWARPATMPSFRKLYRVVDVDLPAGEYVMRVDEHYDVSAFRGTKAFVLATTSWKGGRNPLLSSLFMIAAFGALVGALALLLIAGHFERRAYGAIAHLLRKS